MSRRVPSLRESAPWIAFLGSLIVYWLTVEPGASLWDCPEYIDGALRLEIGHPPGNPTWLLFHRIVSLFGLSAEGAVRAINMASGFFTAWAVGLLCACSQRTLRLLSNRKDASDINSRVNKREENIISFCSVLGALCFGWADSPWFSAVEAEVYAMSLWMTALCVWLTLKWLGELNSGRRWQYLILISYILGLSIGVHQLTMLVIPGLAMIVCYGITGGDRRARGRQWIAAVAGAVIVAVVLFGLMKGVTRILAWAELYSVNRLGLPYHTGTISGWILIIVFFGLLAILSACKRRRIISGISWCLFFVCIGFSSYALTIIRATAAPPMNQGDPSDIFSFITYIDRDQYGGAPLLYGSTPYSKPLKREHVRISPEGDTIRSYYGNVRIPERPYYSKNIPGGRVGNAAGLISPADLRENDSLSSLGRDSYLLTGYKVKLKMIPELEMWFPRLHSSNPADVAAYADWTGMTDETMVRVRISEAADSLGRPVPIKGPDGKPTGATGLRPSCLQNLTMLFGYQSGYMYFRYLLWNFGGRQNDVHSCGEVEHGNFITGDTMIDNLMLGAEDAIPDEVGKDNPGRNRYWMIPFILGILGLVSLCSSGRTGRRIAGVSAVLFLMTGPAIVLYLNQTPGEPRERDYSFLASFWVFGFWIAAGMLQAIRYSIKSKGLSKDNHLPDLISPQIQHLEGAEYLFRNQNSSPEKSKSIYNSQRIFPIIVACLLSIVPLLMLIENYDDHDRSGRYPADDYAGAILSSVPENAILFTTGDNHTFPLWYARNSRGIRRDVAIVNTNYLQLPWQALQLMRADETGQRVPMTMKPEDIAYGAFNAIRVSRDTTLIAAREALSRLYNDTSTTPRLPSTRLLIEGRRPFVFDLTKAYGIEPGGIMTFKQLALLDIVATNALTDSPRPIVWHRSLATKGYEGWKSFTTPLPFMVILDPDSVFNPTPVYKNILAYNPIGKPGRRYIDPVYGSLISWRRMALMTDARRKLDEGDTLTVRRLLNHIATRYPFSEWRPDFKAFDGETIDEGLLYAELADRANINLSLADSLRKDTRLRNRQWKRYRNALPFHLRRTMTPANRRRATDSLP